MSTFSLKIGVEGEKAFKQSLYDINQSFKVLGSEMKLVESQFDKNDNSIGALCAKNEVLTKQITEQKEKIETLRKALENASSSFGENDRRTKAWAAQLNNAQAELNSMERELKANEKAINGVSDEFDSAEKQAEQFGEEVEDTGGKADDAGGKFEKLGGILKGVGAVMGAVFVAVGTAAVGAAKALTDMTVGAAAYADEMLTVSTVTGLSTEKLQAYKYAAGLVDVSLETLTDSMAKQIKSMSSVKDVSAEVSVDTKKLASAQSKASGAATALEQAQLKLNSATLSVENAQSKSESALLDVDKAQIKYNETISKYGLYSSEAALAAADLEKAQKKAAEAANGVLTAQNNAALAALTLEKAQIALTEAHAAVTNASAAVSPEIDAMTAAYNRLGVKARDSEGNLRDGETVYWELIDALGEVTNETERDALAMQIFGKSAQELNPLIAQGSAGIAALTEEAKQMGAVMSGDTLTAFGKFDDSVQRLKSGSEAAKNALGSVLLPQLQVLADGGVSLLGEFTRGMNAAGGDFGKMSEVISKTISGIADMVLQNLPMIMTVATDIVMALVNSITGNLIKWLVPFICGGAISLSGTVLAVWKSKRKRQRAVEDGLQCLLRFEIIRSYEKYSERGFAPVYAKEALRRVYISYHTLDGNDVATDLYNKTMALPTEPKKNEEHL